MKKPFQLVRWRWGGLLALLAVSGCAHPSNTFYVPGYAEGQTYVTKAATPAIIVRDGATGKVTDAEFNPSADAGQSAGQVETVAAGTKIRIEKVIRQDDPDQGVRVRVTAKVDSGPYDGAMANLSNLSTPVQGPNGRPSDLVPNPDWLLKVDE